VNAVYYGLNKAFDTVSYNILTDKLMNMGKIWGQRGGLKSG